MCINLLLLLEKELHVLHKRAPEMYQCCEQVRVAAQKRRLIANYEQSY